MAQPQIPKTQQDALPLITVGDAIAQAADTVTIIGSTIIKKWGPAATGINGSQDSNIADPTTAGQVYLLTNWLDFSGMTRFTVALATQIPIGGIAGNVTQNWVLRVIAAAQQSGGTIVEPVPNPPGPDRHNLLGSIGAQLYPQVGAFNIQAIAGLVAGDLPLNMSSCCGWSIGGAPGVGGSVSLGCAGTCRLWLGATAGATVRFNWLTVIAEA
jgi:hypothetical protein